jgi:hypothetical protein
MRISSYSWKTSKVGRLVTVEASLVLVNGVMEVEAANVGTRKTHQAKWYRPDFKLEVSEHEELQKYLH